jgi:putative membrane protein
MVSVMVWRTLPYCGSPAVPDALWDRWNLDPVLIAAVVLLGALYEVGMRRAGMARAPRSAAFYAGWSVGALALISPLCPLSVALFSARIGQHMALTLVAAPLIALGRPDLMAAKWLRPSPFLAAATFAILLWVWHAPQPYALTFQSTAVYWAMHLSLIASSIWLWSAMIQDLGRRGFTVALVALASSIQMGLLGGLITLAPYPLYAPHLLTTAAWGLTPLEDQQLGGALMWAPGCLAYLGMAVIAFSAVLVRLDCSRSRTTPAPARA